MSDLDLRLPPPPRGPDADRAAPPSRGAPMRPSVRPQPQGGEHGWAEPPPRTDEEEPYARVAAVVTERPPAPAAGVHELPEGWLPCPKGADPDDWVLDPSQPEPKIRLRHLTKAFGSRVIWEDVTFDIPMGLVTVVLGPSGTGKSVLLRHLIGLLQPSEGQVWVDDKNVPTLPNRELLRVRKKFGVLFQDGALFGSMTIFDNVAFPLREHTRKNEKEIREIVEHNLEIVGLGDAAKLFPGEISGGMRKRAGLARGLVLDPEILLFDEPDSGLDPVRTAYLNELILDLKDRLESTFVIVTHHIPTAKNVGDHLALLYSRRLMLAGPKERLLESDMAAVRQFLRGSTRGPIGMSEEKDSANPTATVAEYADGDAEFALEDMRDDEALPGSHA